MKIQFKQQQYQINAVDAVIRCFSGQEGGMKKAVFDRFYNSKDHRIIDGMDELLGFVNPDISLSQGELLKNIQDVQRQANLPISSTFNSRDFTIEMETGTGKTYVYLRTIFELSKNYNWNKFIIVVPSIAIREGAHKSLEITAEHFSAIYGKKIQFYIYDNKNKSNLNNIKHFASSDSLQVIVMNYQGFNATEDGRAKGTGEASRKIFQNLDVMGSYRPIDMIERVRPIIIIDEPQRISDKTENILKNNFNPLFTLRYSATHKKNFHKIYRLDAIDAISQKLVKKIRAFGYEERGSSGSTSYIFVDRIETKKGKNPVAYIEIEVLQNSGIAKKIFKFEIGDDLYYKSNELKQYEGWKITNINARDNVVTIANQITGFEVGKIYGGIDPIHLARLRIRNTIQEHLRKEESLFKKGIKVLSLFFIDEVSKYRAYDEEGQKITSEYEKIFEEEYASLVAQKNMFTPEYNEYLERFEPQDVHGGYFSIDKGKAIDTKSSETANVDEYTLIMKDKERLLSFEEPMRFIFSHSALSEGWDNPNVFQICMLRASTSDIKRRQEVGRGLRICVDSTGRRMDESVLGEEFENYNCLTVIAAESYESFATGLQDEMRQSLEGRPVILSDEILKVYNFSNDGSNEPINLGTREIARLVGELTQKGYLSESRQVTSVCMNDISNGTFVLSEEFSDIEDGIIRLLKESDSLKKMMEIEKGMSPSVNEKNLMPNQNFDMPEFQELWNLINYKSAYKVSFDSKKLIEQCVESLNTGINIKHATIRLSIGEQNMNATQTDLQNSTMITKMKTHDENIDQVLGNIKYDIIGEIMKETEVTRKTIASILAQINPSEFIKYTYNPQGFIKEVIRVIKAEKSKIANDGIIYYKIDQKLEKEDLSMDFVGQLNKDILEVEKHIYDYLKWDSEIERKFAEDMEKGMVKIYAKLPNAFKINTPIGDYNPDWARVMEDKNVKYVYFIAETKGNSDNIYLRTVEQLKISYARKHFQLIESDNVKYDVISGYDELLCKINPLK